MIPVTIIRRHPLWRRIMRYRTLPVLLRAPRPPRAQALPGERPPIVQATLVPEPRPSPLPALSFDATPGLEPAPGALPVPQARQTASATTGPIAPPSPEPAQPPAEQSAPDADWGRLQTIFRRHQQSDAPLEQRAEPGAVTAANPEPAPDVASTPAVGQPPLPSEREQPVAMAPEAAEPAEQRQSLRPPAPPPAAPLPTPDAQLSPGTRSPTTASVPERAAGDTAQVEEPAPPAAPPATEVELPPPFATSPEPATGNEPAAPAQQAQDPGAPETAGERPDEPQEGPAQSRPRPAPPPLEAVWQVQRVAEQERPTPPEHPQTAARVHPQPTAPAAPDQLAAESAATRTTLGATAPDATRKPPIQAKRTPGSSPEPARATLPEVPPTGQKTVSRDVVGTVTPEDAARVETVLSAVQPGRPSASRVQLMLPRRPRPVFSRPLQTEPAKRPAAKEVGADRRTEDTQVAITPEVEAADAGAQASASRPVSRSEEVALVATEVGPLPADLWRMLDRPAPRQKRPVPDRSAEKPAPEQLQAAEEQRAVQPPAPPPTSPRPAPAGESVQQVTPPPRHDSSTTVMRSAAPSAGALAGSAAGDAETTKSERNDEPALAPDVDVDELARQVYAQLKRRLSIEWERVRGLYGNSK